MSETLFTFADDRKPWQKSVAEGGYDISKMARPTDPATSFAAAKKAATKAGTLRALVLASLKDSPKTHDELIAALPGWSASGVRSRCSELVADGLVVQDGQRTSALGNKATVWRAA